MVDLMKARKLSPMAFADGPAVLADITRAEERLRELESPPALRRLLGDPDQDIAQRWQAAPMTARREVVRLVFQRLALDRAPSPGHRGAVAGRVQYQWRQP